MVEAAQAKLRPKVDSLRAEVQNDTKTVAQYAEQCRPKLGDTAVDLQRAQMAWEGVRARLSAGMSMRQILREATLEEFLAISEWVPAHMEAEAFKARGAGIREALDYAAPSRDWLHAAVEERLGAIAPDSVGWAMLANREAAAAQASFAPIADHIAATLDGGGGSDRGLVAAVESALAAQQARPSLADDGDEAA